MNTTKALREAKAWLARWVASGVQETMHADHPAVLLAELVAEIEAAPVGIVEVDAYPWPSIDGADFPENWPEGQRVRVLAVGEE